MRKHKKSGDKKAIAEKKKELDDSNKNIKKTLSKLKRV